MTTVGRRVVYWAGHWVAQLVALMAFPMVVLKVDQ